MARAESFVVAEPKADELMFDYGAGAEYPETLYQYGGLVSGVTGFDQVGPTEIARFHEQGYLVVHEAFDVAEVQAALDGLRYLIAGENPNYKGLMYEKKAQGVDIKTLSADERQDYIRKFMWFVDYDERLKAMAAHPKLLEVVTRMIGETPRLYQDMALIKPPRIGREKPWHQDHAYFDLPLTATVVGVWIALDEATTENGCMVIYPGSHRQGPVVHFNQRDWQICDTHDRANGAAAVPLKPGGALFFHSLIQHGTPANSSTHRRRAVQFHYAPASAMKTSQDDRLAIFGSEGKDVTC